MCCAVLSCSVVYDSWHDSLYGAWTVALQAPLSTGILQARIQDWVTMPFSRGSSVSRDGHVTSPSTNQRIVYELITHPGTALPSAPTMPFKIRLWMPSGSSGIFEN